MSRITVAFLAASVLVVLSACTKEPAATTPSASASTSTPASPPTDRDGPQAEVGSPAPDFTLKDLDGKEVRLSSFKGKTVVLEWFNPNCPFVERSHNAGSLKEAAKRHTKNGVVWLAVNSGAPGKQGHGVDANRDGAKRYGMTHPILLDETGQVGKRYGATNTPHMFVIDATGTLVYRGAIDNSPDGEGEAAPDGKLVSYVDEAVTAVSAGKTPATTKTKAYGCAVKYAAAH